MGLCAVGAGAGRRSRGAGVGAQRLGAGTGAQGLGVVGGWGCARLCKRAGAVRSGLLRSGRAGMEGSDGGREKKKML
ncbi:hypothetical protein ACOSQ4_004590 [Xanthoceras sorbifolium]